MFACRSEGAGQGCRRANGGVPWGEGKGEGQGMCV